MLLHTYQGDRFENFGDKIDPEKSSYAQEPVIRQAYEKLFKIVRTNQLLWAVPHELAPIPSNYQWHYVLDAENDKVAVINSFHWEHIIGNKRYCPQSLTDEWRGEFRRLKMSTPERFQREPKLIDNYLRENLPIDLWQNLISDNVDGFEEFQVLLRFPFTDTKIILEERVLH